MKKLSIHDETVHEQLRMSSVSHESLRDIKELKGTVDRKLAKELEKREKVALTEARQSVVLNGESVVGATRVSLFFLRGCT